MNTDISSANAITSPRRARRWTSILLLASFLTSQASSLPSLEVRDANECQFTVEGLEYDMRPLDKPRHFTLSVPTPPTITNTTYTVSLCTPIPHDSSVPDIDQCPEGTRVCMLVVNDKLDQGSRVIGVVPVAGEVAGRTFERDTKLEDKGSGDVQKPLIVTLKGGKYNDQDQSARITFHCDPNTEDLTDPTFDSYQPGSGLLSLTWRNKHACAVNTKEGNQGGGGGGGDDGTLPRDPVKGGLGFFGWFFLLLFLGFGAYFVIGAYYNYSQYGASGFDLIPNKDFWRDVPYIVRDIFSGRGSNRGGYSALS